MKPQRLKSIVFLEINRWSLMMNSLKIILGLLAAFLVANLSRGDDEHHGGEASEDYSRQYAAELALKADAKYTEEFLNYLNSKEFANILNNEEREAGKKGRDARFYIAGYIRGIMTYSTQSGLKKAEGTFIIEINHMKLPWSVLEDEYWGWRAGCTLGLAKGTPLAARLQSAALKEFAEQMDKMDKIKWKAKK
jgi:hypothetical protein